MVHYKPVKVSINILRLAEVIINVINRHHGFFDSIVTNRGLFFTLKFWSLLCYFFVIKYRLSTTFYPQIDGQTKRQNSRIKANLGAFVNFKQNDWAKFLSMAKFAYHNPKNATTGHTLFELNCGYHPRIFYKKNVNSYSKSKLANELSAELRKLMTVC